MANQQKIAKSMHSTLWVAQVVLAIIFIMGAVMKFMPIEKIAVIMPWTGQLPTPIVRISGVIDFAGAIGLILPSLLRISPQLTPWAAVCAIVLMICAIIFHVSRGEASVIGLNLFAVLIAAFIAWGRFMKAPIPSK